MKSTLMTASVLILVLLSIVDYASVYAEFIDSEISLERQWINACFNVCMKISSDKKYCKYLCGKN
uniref:Potassium channel toxin kappa-KTx 3.1 n=1 Tax=Heterometrus petersii TaxID=754296 RepID=KKX31_HETPE|nr:RecName: Full=Potassium channel toxin kappa-KTx 3.1; AltName: Full=HSP040C.1; Flags: Precursor [Heterometrus petersii]